MDNIVGLLSSIIPFVLVFVIFYFLIVLPEKKRKKKYESMVSELKVSDEIVTRGGIIGKIISIEENGITIETSSAKTKLKIDKNGISYKIKAD